MKAKSFSFSHDMDISVDPKDLKKLIDAARKEPEANLFGIFRGYDDPDVIVILADDLEAAQKEAKKAYKGTGATPRNQMEPLEAKNEDDDPPDTYFVYKV